jgi:hypothetical protein
MDVDKVPQVSDIKDKLTKRNFKFIELLSQGLSVVEAYKAAGYKGTNDQQPYQLSHSLKHKISEYLQVKGFNKENLAIQLDKLVSLPLRHDQTAVTIDQKIRMLRLFKDSLPESEKKEEPKFSRFTVVNNYVKVDTDNQLTRENTIDITPEQTGS